MIFFATCIEMQRYPASPPPLSQHDTYTTWPGGVDPTARVYDSVGGVRRNRKATRKAVHRKRKATRKAVHRNRKATRKATQRK
jgi:hypothetical protein